MAAETEGIALLSMYNDEEEDEGEEEPSPPPGPAPTLPLPPEENGVGGDEGGGAAPTPEQHPLGTTPPPPLSRSSLLSEAEPEFKILRSPTPPPPQPVTQTQAPLAYSFPGRPPTPPMAAAQVSVRESLDAARAGRPPLTIVDYGHDDVAMSPDHEDGEILTIGMVVVGTELWASSTNLVDETPPGTVQILTPSTHQASQPPDLPEQSKTESISAMDFTGAEPEEPHVEEATVVSTDMRNDVDPLSNFLPLPPMTKCSEHLQEKINTFVAYKRVGKSFNVALRNRKDYRNPDFLQHAVRYQDIDQIGTCFTKDVFDPYGYDKSDYYDEIEADMRREMERKEQERKKSQKVDFVSGGTQPGTVASALRINTQIPATSVSAAATSTLPANSAVDSTSRDVRKNKKSKWDKVDGDMKNSLHSGAHDLSTVGVHAAHLSAANAGAGYTAFAQQKRKEAEEKKSSERKSERRS